MDKIKTINIQAMVGESDAGKAAIAELQKHRAVIENELKNISGELQRIEGDIQSFRSDAMNAGKKAVASASTQGDTERKIRDLEYKKNELQAKGQRLVQEGQNDLMMKEQELMAPIINDIVQVVAQLGKEKGLDLVIDESSGRVLYKKDGLDITSDALKLANKAHQQKVTLAKNKPAVAPKAPTTKVA